MTLLNKKLIKKKKFKMKIEYPFYIPFIYKDCDFFNEIKDDLLQVIMKIHEQKPFALQGNFPALKQLKKNLTESNHRFLGIENDSVVRLRNWIGISLIESYKELRINTKKITFSESWFHVTKKGGYHNFHHHSNTPLAGIFYLQDGNSDIGNRWINPIPGYIDKMSSNWCREKYDSKFIPGRLILFPGWLLHSALPHEGNKLRVVIAFNSRPE